MTKWAADGADDVGVTRARLLEVQAAERRRIAADIHDDPIQVLTVAVMRLDLLGGSIDDAGATEKLQDARSTVRAAIDRLRRMLFELHPPSLERDGLAPALEEYSGEMFAGTGVEIVVTSDVEREPTLAVRSSMFRVAREAIANACRHAAASRLDIRVGAVRGGIEVRVADDGKGFTPTATHEGHHAGVAFAAALASGAGGWWSIDSAPGRGTVVEFWMPDVVLP